MGIKEINKYKIPLAYKEKRKIIRMEAKAIFYVPFKMKSFGP